MDGFDTETTPQYSHNVGMGKFSDGFIHPSESDYEELRWELIREMTEMKGLAEWLFPWSLHGDGMMFSLSDNSSMTSEDCSDQHAFQSRCDEIMSAGNTNWAVSRFGEKREKLFTQLGFTQMVDEKRFHHLWLDVWADEWTHVASIVEGEVVDSGYEDGEGNYGWYVVIKKEDSEWPLYFFIGHLDPETIPKKGSKLSTGDPIGQLGSMEQNGGYFYHLHLQILTQEGFQNGYQYKGYETEENFQNIEQYVLDPRSYFKWLQG